MAAIMQRSETTTARASTRARHGFTMTEILVVIGIIISLIALAVPAISVIRGNRSTEAAENQLNAFMARARSEAIGNQRTTGLFFFRDPKNPDRVTCAEVEQVPVPSGVVVARECYLDLVPERDFLILPPGVGVQFVDDCNVRYTNNVGQRQDDAYIGYNTPGQLNAANTNVDSIIKFGGVVLFDSNGRLVCESYGFRIRPDVNGTPSPGAATAMGDLLFYDPNASFNPARPLVPKAEFFEPGYATLNQSPWLYPRSQFGLVVFDANAFQTAFGDAGDTDPQLTATNYVQTKEAVEEKWLDENGIPLIANRYNGTLSRGE
ncbi:MAG TPA: hypothetical protein VF669_23680 [Tepidisphaeraceae bacterium]|jgi:type II secretory pathway pseudopilin PulG